MERISVKIEVSRENAIRAGKAEWGKTEVQFTETMLGSMTSEEREELILALGSIIGNGLLLEDTYQVSHTYALETVKHRYEESLSEATVDAVLEVLRQRIAHRRAAADKLASGRLTAEVELEAALTKRAEELRASGPEALVDSYGTYDIHPFVLSYRERFADMWDTIAAIQAERKAADAARKAEWKAREEAEREEKKLFPAKLKAFILEHFTTHRDTGCYVVRAETGLLPEEEALGVLRDTVFGALDAIAQRYARMSSDDLIHDEECSYGSTSVAFETVHSAGLDEEAFMAYEQLRAAIATAVYKVLRGAHIEPRTHIGSCEHCGGRMQKASALVSLTWYGRKISREYALHE